MRSRCYPAPALLPAAIGLAGDMVGAIIVSAIALGELVSLTLAPAMLAAMRC